MKRLLPCLLLAASLAAGLATSVQAFDHAAAVEAWRSERLQRLRAPDGWLSLVGLHWLEPGTHTLGRAEGNAIVLQVGPPQLGEVHWIGGELMFTPHPDAVVLLGSERVTGPLRLDADPRPRIEYEGGRASLEAIERGGRFALRERDAQAPTRLQFAGIPAYPVDASWRFDARFEPHPRGHTIDIVNVLGQTEAMTNPGQVVFVHEGREYSLQAVDDGGRQLWAIFADRTNRDETYGGGRFIYFDRPLEGVTELDFNRAYNPPCAFTEFSTCPLPPPENRLDLRVSAGERRYTAADGVR